MGEQNEASSEVGFQEPDSEVCVQKVDHGHLGGSVVERLPWAQGMTPGSWDRVPRRAPCTEPAPFSLCLCLCLSLSLSLMNKYVKSLTNKQNYVLSTWDPRGVQQASSLGMSQARGPPGQRIYF